MRVQKSRYGYSRTSFKRQFSRDSGGDSGKGCVHQAVPLYTSAIYTDSPKMSIRVHSGAQRRRASGRVRERAHGVDKGQRKYKLCQVSF